MGDPRMPPRDGLFSPVVGGLIVQRARHDFECTMQMQSVVHHAVRKASTHGIILNVNIYLWRCIVWSNQFMLSCGKAGIML